MTLPTRLARLLLVATLPLTAILAVGTAQASIVANPDCTLVVPAQPLTAVGLATPYQLTATNPAAGACNEVNPDQSAFVEAAVLDPATGTLSTYHPVVVDQGTDPAAKPVVPTLPVGAVVGIWFGANGDTLRLAGPGAAGAVTGFHGSVFGQFSYINAPAFFTAANQAIAVHRLVVPPLGMATDHKPCPTVRDFMVVDQDQSDNVGTGYWTVGGKVQNVPANPADATVNRFVNGSDEGLLGRKIDPALNCKPWLLPTLDGSPAASSLAANELSAAATQGAPSALVPLNDPMTLVGDHFSGVKTNRYRAGVDQPALPAGQGPWTYCADIRTIGAPRIEANRVALTNHDSPTANVNLYDFLKARMATALTELGCKTTPVTHHAHHGHHRDDD